MNTKWNLLIAIALLAMLAGMNTTPVKAADGSISICCIPANGDVGVPYTYTFTATGGQAPYTFTLWGEYDWPSELTLSPEGVLSGTPTKAGDFYFSVQAQDASGATGTLSSLVKIMTDGTFTLTSSSNPSALGTAVTFTFSASGGAWWPDYPPGGLVPPYGLVTFKADGENIAGCSGLLVNYQIGPWYVGDWPATCTTSALGRGSHEITAVFTDESSFFHGATRTLDQVVGLSISPDTLPDGTYAAEYFQQLTIGGGSGSYSILWVSDTLPQGIILWPSTGELSGYPGETGTFTFFVQVQDNNDPANPLTKEYTLVIGKEPVKVTLRIEPEISASGQGFDIWADLNPFIQDVGTFAFYLDDAETPISGCEAVPAVGLGAHCAGGTDLAAGEHKLTAVLTPTDTWSSRISPTIGTATHTVGYRIGGTVFEDLNKDGVFGEGEPLTGVDWTIYLDQDCDGMADQAAGSGSDGTYEFTTVPGGHCYRISLATDAGWRQTVTLTDIASLSQDITDLNIGAYPWIGFYANDPPKGEIGVPYSFAFSAYGGGTEPLTYTLVDNEYGQPSVLPAGLTLSSEGLLSGTPTAGGAFPLGMQITDANGAHSDISHTYLIITLDGEFSLTSSSNPSIPDEPVTFTLAATGDYFDPDPRIGAVPPLGYVTFLDAETPIEGCTQVPLNIIFDEGGMPVGFGNYPASCTVQTLALGTHTITAAFTEVGLQFYRNATITLNQVVNPATSADLSLTKVDSKDPVKRGAQLVYTLTVKNLGTNAAQSVKLIDTLDRNTNYVSVSAPKGWSCKYASYAVTCTSSSLASGGSAIVKITVTVSKTAKLGKELVNGATVSSTTYDPVMTNNSVVQKTLVSR